MSNRPCLDAQIAYLYVHVFCTDHDVDRVCIRYKVFGYDDDDKHNKP